MAGELWGLCDSLVVTLEEDKESHALLGMQCAYILMTMSNKGRNKESYSNCQPLYLVRSNKILETKPTKKEQNSLT